MLDFNNEIESCLKSINNTNDKEQNFQGRLYAHFLPFEKDGYIVEMETSVNDEHLKSILKDRMHDNTPSDFTKADFHKIEIDLLVYKPDQSELYAAELKWIYNRTNGWNVVDHLEDFKADAIFCHQLVKKAKFTQTCTIVVYDFCPEKQVRRFCPRDENTKAEKYDFLGGSYPAKNYGRIQSDESGGMSSFKWVQLVNHTDKRKYKYYIIKFGETNIC